MKLLRKQNFQSSKPIIQSLKKLLLQIIIRAFPLFLHSSPQLNFLNNLGQNLSIVIKCYYRNHRLNLLHKVFPPSSFFSFL